MSRRAVADGLMGRKSTQRTNSQAKNLARSSQHRTVRTSLSDSDFILLVDVPTLSPVLFHLRRFESAMSEESDSPPDPMSGFSEFRGPANWFTLQVPAMLNLQQTEAFFEITPRMASAATTDAGPARDQDESTEPLGSKKNAVDAASLPWSLTLYAAWVEEDQPNTDAASFSPATLFPKVIKSSSAGSLPIDATNRSWTGQSIKANGSWWRRLFQKRNSYEWRLWVIEYQQIIMVASLQSQQGRALDVETVNVCNHVLSSICFAEELARPPELFRREVVGLARKHFPLLEVTPAGNFGIRINESEIHLTNFYRSYLQAPDRLKQIVLPGITTVVRLQEWGPEQLMPALDAVADRIMPMLYPESEAESSLQEFVRVPWVAGLSIMFVVDEDDTYRFVHKAMLKTWDVTAEDLQSLAMDNLARFAEDHPLEVTLVGEDDDPRMLVPVTPHAYNTVRLLGGELHGRLRQVLGAELVVGVPNRDFFVAISLNHPKLIGEIQRQVAHDFQAMHHPLTSRLLVISADGVSEYC